MSDYRDIENLEESGSYLSDIMLDQKIVTKVKNNGSFDLSETEGTENSLLKRLNRKNIIYYGIMQGEQVVNIEQATFEYQAPIIQIEQLRKRLNRIKEEHRSKIGYIHLNSVQMIIRSTFKEGIKTPVEIIVEDNRIQSQDLKELGRIEGDLGYGVIKFNVTLQYPIPLVTKTINNCISISCNFKQKNLMKNGDIPLVVCYQVAYALSNSSISLNYKHLDRLYTNRIFNETSTIIKTDKLHREFLRNHGNRSFRIFDKPSSSGLIKNELDEPITKRTLSNENEVEKINSQNPQGNLRDSPLYEGLDEIGLQNSILRNIPQKIKEQKEYHEAISWFFDQVLNEENPDIDQLDFLEEEIELTMYNIVKLEILASLYAV